MFQGLWANAELPKEYLYYKVFYEKFGWLPDEVDRQSAIKILEILTIYDVEAKVNKKKNQLNNGK